MSPLRSIAYLSSTRGALSDADLERLLLDARTFNESVAVTGVLLYNGLSFFQYFEGDTAACEQVFERIRGSSQHHAIHTIADAPTPTRQFSTWAMAFSKASTSEMLAISRAQWLDSPVLNDPAAPGEPSGIAMLKAFWQAANGSP